MKINYKQYLLYPGGYRLVKSTNYDGTMSPPEFQCEACSQKKTEKLRLTGVNI